MKSFVLGFKFFKTCVQLIQWSNTDRGAQTHRMRKLNRAQGGLGREKASASQVESVLTAFFPPHSSKPPIQRQALLSVLILCGKRKVSWSDCPSAQHTTLFWLAFPASFLPAGSSCQTALTKNGTFFLLVNQHVFLELHSVNSCPIGAVVWLWGL